VTDPFAFLARTAPGPAWLEPVRAEGARITDASGRTYLDFLAGIGVCNTGHRHPRVLEAVRRQVDVHLHVMVYGEWAQAAQSAYAERLCGLVPVPDPRVYFVNSGAEAIEGALKAARKATGRSEVAAFEGSYHGDTLGALSILGVEAMRKPFEPLLPGVTCLPWDDPGAFVRITERTAAVVVEPIQAEGGVRVPAPGFLAKLRTRCDAVGALLILDEVQTGLGRTGRLWACDHDGVRPDLLVLAKALGGGFPLGAFVGPERVMRALAQDPPLGHLTTFGGHPVSCAAGLAALEVTLADGLPARAEVLGARLRDRLGRAAGVREVRGRGLLAGVALESAERAEAAVRQCRERGLIVGTALHDPSVLRLTPPLTLTDAELDEGAAILAAALQ
jgi:acetylornithine/N-succinyldiaminopimelate aminotransferase